MSVFSEIETVAKKIEAGFMYMFHAVEHEVPMIFATLVNIYGPEVVAHAVDTYKGNIETFAGSEAAVAEADLKALVQSSVVEKFNLPPTAAQFIASAIHHLFTIGESTINSLIESGAAAIEAQTAPPVA